MSKASVVNIAKVIKAKAVICRKSPATTKVEWKELTIITKTFIIQTPQIVESWVDCSAKMYGNRGGGGGTGNANVSSAMNAGNAGPTLRRGGVEPTNAGYNGAQTINAVTTTMSTTPKPMRVAAPASNTTTTHNVRDEVTTSLERTSKVTTQNELVGAGEQKTTMGKTKLSSTTASEARTATVNCAAKAVNSYGGRNKDSVEGGPRTQTDVTDCELFKRQQIKQQQQEQKQAVRQLQVTASKQEQQQQNVNASSAQKSSATKTVQAIGNNSQNYGQTSTATIHLNQQNNNKTNANASASASFTQPAPNTTYLSNVSLNANASAKANTYAERDQYNNNKCINYPPPDSSAGYHSSAVSGYPRQQQRAAYSNNNNSDYNYYQQVCVGVVNKNKNT